MAPSLFISCNRLATKGLTTLVVGLSQASRGPCLSKSGLCMFAVTSTHS